MKEVHNWTTGKFDFFILIPLLVLVSANYVKIYSDFQANHHLPGYKSYSIGAQQAVIHAAAKPRIHKHPGSIKSRKSQHPRL